MLKEVKFLQKKILNIIVLVLVLFSSIVPIVVKAGRDIKSQPITDIKNSTKSIVSDNYDMIIIAPSSYSSALVSFIEHKNNHEIFTKFVSTDDIYFGTYFEVKGRDNQEKIKYFIRDAIESWGINYVLFIGSFKQVPVRYSNINDMYSSSELKFVSELYYADIYDSNGNFSSWDSDKDGTYGEWDGNNAEDRPIDLTPDVCLGRLACVNIEEVRTVTNKIITYEKQPANPTWFKRMVVVGGDTYSEFEGNEGEIYTQQAIDEMNDFTTIKFWVSNGNLKKNGWNIISEINKGCGFWYLSGHGNSNIWVTKATDGSQVGTLNSFHLLFLFNRHKYPVCLVGGCHNSEFDMTAYKYIKALNLFTWLRECWSWQLVSKSNGGSIATIGATGLAWYGVEYGGGGTNWLNVQFFKEYADDTVILGQICKNALTRYIETYPIDWETPSGDVSSIDAKTVQEWTLLGDPSLKIGGYSTDNFKGISKL